MPGNNNFVDQRKYEEYCQGYHDRLENNSKFYSRLAKDIRCNGINNPILVHAGYCTPIYQKYLPKGISKEEVLCTDRNGGSRLWIAQNLNLTVPIIVADFVNRFETYSDFIELLTIEDIKNKFKDAETMSLLSNEHGLHVGNLSNPYLFNNNK